MKLTIHRLLATSRSIFCIHNAATRALAWSWRTNWSI